MQGGEDEGQDPGLPNQSIWDIPFEDLDFKEKIGKGSFGSVYRGTYLGVEVAIKKIEKADDPEYLKYIDREVSMLQSIRHPFIVQFSGICVHSSGLYIVTEFVSGGDVRRLIKANPNLAWKRKLRIAIDLAKAMLFLHSKRIIHRDLKSKNILLDEHGRIRLCDFGFARMAETKRARHMTMCGTEGWVAPEILMGMSYDTSCDVFSYGVVVAELLTGKKPGVDLWVRTPENCYDINSDELRVKAVPGCPPRFLETCVECCHYEPLLRPRFEEVLQVLIAIDREMPAADSTPVSPPPSATSPRAGRLPEAVPVANGHPSPQPAPTSGWKAGAKSFRSSTPPAPSPVASKPAPSLSPAAAPISILPPKSDIKDDGSRSSADASLAAVNTHLLKMVERATTDYYYDASYINDLLMSYRCFTTPQKLFDLLVQRYNGTPADFLPAAELEAWHKSHKVIQLRVIIFFKRWIDSYWIDFDVEGMDDRLMVFEKILFTQASNGGYALRDTKASVSFAPGDESIRLIALLQKKRGTGRPKYSPEIDITINTPAPITSSSSSSSSSIFSSLSSSSSSQHSKSSAPLSKSPPSSSALQLAATVWKPVSEVVDVLDVPALELAKQVTHIASCFYANIHPREYFEYCFGRSAESGPCWVGGDVNMDLAQNIQHMYRWSRDLSRLVATDIIRRPEKAKRAQVLERYIEAADRCAALKNFDSVFAIVGGLTHSSIERLSETMKQLSPKTLQLFESLKNIVRKDNDHKSYRTALNDSSPPCIPCLDQVLQEMWFLECSSTKVLTGGIVNFFHYRQITRKVLLYQQFLPSPQMYNIKPVLAVQRLLLRNGGDAIYDDETLKKHSLMREEPNFS